jgi:hypothetical protein
MDRPPASRISRRTLLRQAGVAAGALAVGGSLPAAAATTAGRAALTGAAGGGTLLQLARVWVDHSSAHLLNDFDDTHTVFDDGSVELLLWPGDRAKLAATGLRHEITVPDLIARDTAEAQSAGARSASLPLQPGERGDYRVLADFEADLRDLAARYPDTARLIELPHQSVEGRTVYGIEIATDVHRNDGRAVYYVDGIHHAREWPAAEMPIMFAFDLLESYGTDPQVRRIVDGVRTIIVPVMNPDGYHWSRSAMLDVQGTGNPATGDSYWRKNRRTEPHPLDPVVDNFGAYGIDPNRNYTYAWGGDGSSASQTSGTYRGPEPLSEPECRNVAHLLRTHHATAMITHHTSGRLVLWAWSWTLDDLNDQALIEGLGRAMAAHNGYRPQKSIDLYIHTGVCVDYGYGTFGTISYTFEHATSFHPAYAATIPKMYADNRAAFLLLAEEACLPPEQRAAGRELPAVLAASGYDRDGLHHAVIQGRLVDAGGQPVAGTIRLRKDFTNPLWFRGDGNNPVGQPDVPEFVDTVMDTQPDGSFVYHVNPSTRPHVEAAGGREAYTLIAAAGAAAATMEVVVDRGQTLDLGTVSLAP